MTTSPNDPPPLPEALVRFSTFLESNGWPSRIEWVDASNVSLVRGVAFFGSTWAEHEVERKYEQAIARGLGIQLYGMWQAEGVSVCFLYAPTDRVDAEYRMMGGGLKLSVATDPRPARLVGTARALWARLLGRTWNFEQ
ncbi:MAG: hypothetical protein OXU20_09550 [Myxococcales bacterium]|nr:hypothetical protein [Myxococcales bacterium]MDD9966655.1 hypothetical protein [Myxococcales bacterium]